MISASSDQAPAPATARPATRRPIAQSLWSSSVSEIAAVAMEQDRNQQREGCKRGRRRAGEEAHHQRQPGADLKRDGERQQPCRRRTASCSPARRRTPGSCPNLPGQRDRRSAAARPTRRRPTVGPSRRAGEGLQFGFHQLPPSKKDQRTARRQGRRAEAFRRRRDERWRQRGLHIPRNPSSGRSWRWS